MDDEYIRGYRMTDIESQIFQTYESDKVFQRVVDALNKIGCTSFILSKEEIEQMFKDGRVIKYDSLCN